MESTGKFSAKADTGRKRHKRKTQKIFNLLRRPGLLQ